MKTVSIKAELNIIVKDINKDDISEREEYYFNEYLPQAVFANEIYGDVPEKLADFCCIKLKGKIIVLTNNPVIITLMLQSGIHTNKFTLINDVDDIEQYVIDNYKRLTN